MRSEIEMFELILSYAGENENVRAVVLNGSRANPSMKKDPFQDFDVVYLVRSVAPLVRNIDLVKYFGEILIMQTPEDMGGPPPDHVSHYSYLMQFVDGNRIDLSIYSLTDADRALEDTPAIVLMDKDGVIREPPQSSEVGFLTQEPTAKPFEDCCNEFWWLNLYVAKGLWRDELTYTSYMLDTLMRGELMKMLTWYCGVMTEFHRLPGKLGKHLKEYLEEDIWALLERTYSDHQPENTWEALFVMGELFRRTARRVASTFGLAYPEEDDQRLSNYIRHIKDLPRDSVTFY